MIFTTAAAYLALAVYHEGRSTSHESQLAIAETVINRVSHPDFPSTVSGVVKQPSRRPVTRPAACQFSFWCDGKDDTPHDKVAWQTAQLIAVQALSGDTLRHGATYYHTTKASPSWRHNLHPVGLIGGHIFYTDGKCLLALECSLRPVARPKSCKDMYVSDCPNLEGYPND